MLRVERLRKRYDSGGRRDDAGHLAVDGVSFQVPDGKMYTLLGPSGCGKTTTLRCVAGLETPSDGTISLGGSVLYDAADDINVAPNRRQLGMVFQSYAIWPHMTVAQNVSYPLRIGGRAQRVPKAQVRERVEAALAAVHLEGYEDRRATALSGGQQQRLALARALIARPRMLLLDEPLSNLDAKLRESMRLELKRLQRESGITSLYVTHDQVEALAMSNVVAVMKDGQIVQEGSPVEIYKSPVNAFVADFIGSANLLDGTVRSTQAGDCCVVEVGGGLLYAQPSPASPELRSGQEVLIAMRPECITIEGRDDAQPPAADTPGWLEGIVRNRAFLGESVEHEVEIAGSVVRTRGMDIQPRGIGEHVWLRVRGEDSRIVPTG
ncbi:MAG: ABC transporter ATP-binding protein [Actinobacteria bacterium]|jgi:iron(III) transport system ATP-binding protein|nr:ABC transporter ATP-binding protein [Actinomycetota bacterium]